MIIGLTGGICSGKTKISNYLSDLGAEILDADEVARSVVHPNSPILNELVSSFGTDILNPDNTLNRSKLASIVFNNKNALKKLNKIIHPKIIKIISDKIQEHRQKKEKNIMILSAPLLIETKLYELVDKIWVVDVNPKTQIQRLIHRDNLTEEEASKRIQSQMPAEERLKFADDIIYNSGSWGETRIQIQQLWDKYSKQHSKR